MGRVPDPGLCSAQSVDIDSELGPTMNENCHFENDKTKILPKLEDDIAALDGALLRPNLRRRVLPSSSNLGRISLVTKSGFVLLPCIISI